MAALGVAERAGFARLRKDFERLKTRRDILAKATAKYASNADKTDTGSFNS